MSQRPVAIGLLLCEHLIIEEGTKNVTPVNCFTQRKAEGFPWMSPPFTVLAWLTNGEGAITLEVVVEDADTLEELDRRVMPFRFTAPLQQGRLLLRFISLTFPVAGPYRILLLADKELIAQRKLLVIPKEASHE